MKIAIRVAKISERKGGCAIGAVVVKNGKVIATGQGKVNTQNDPTQHSEMVAIRTAAKRLKTFNLDGCTLYSTLESCSMCFSAALWGNMNAIYFGSYASDHPENDFYIKGYSVEKLAKTAYRWDDSPIKVTGGILRDECIELMKPYKNWSKVK